MSNRNIKLAEKIRHSLSKILPEVYHPELELVSVTISEVKLAEDLRNATIFVHSMAGNIDPLRLVEILNEIKPTIRYAMTKAVQMKYSPEICFKYDKSIDAVANVSKLLHQLSKLESQHAENEEIDDHAEQEGHAEYEGR